MGHEKQVDTFSGILQATVFLNIVPLLATTQRSKMMASTVAIAETERGDKLVTIICMRMRNSLMAGDLSDLMTILLL